MYQLLLGILILDSFLLIAIVLLQAGKGGGLAAMGGGGAGTDSLFGSRQAATLLTRLTWWVGGTFLVISFTLSLMSGTSGQPESILRGVGTPAATPALPPAGAPGVQTTPTAPAPAAPAPGAGETAPAVPE